MGYRYDPVGDAGFPLPAFESAISALRLPSQHFTFTTHRLALHHDPTLAMAYATSLTHAVRWSK